MGQPATSTVTPMYQPDIEAMARHVEHLFGGAPNGLVELAWTDTTPDDSGRYRLRHARLFNTSDLSTLVTEAARLNATPMCNVYIGAALRHPDTAPFGRTKDSDAFALTAAYVDLDDPGAATAAKNIYGKNKPTFVVVTGREPHTRAQLWWRLDEPVTDATKWPELLKAMSVTMNADTSVTNPARVMRLAGTVAWPVKPGRTIEQTGIVTLREPGQSAYSAATLSAAFQAQNAPAAAPVTPSAPRLAATLNAAKPATDRSTFFRQVNDLAMRNTSSWVPTVFGSAAKFQSGTGAWRVSSKELGRHLEEDLSIAPTGIVDFGVHDMGDARQGKRTPVDIVIEHGGAPDAKAAAFWLCEHVGVRPESIGWQEGQTSGSTYVAPAVSSDDQPIHVPDLTGEPAPREWVVENWIPKGVITGLSGDGGMGKTLLAQQLLYAAGTGSEWLSLPIPKMRGLGVFCEDDLDELHRRHDAIKKSMGHSIGNPYEGVWIWPRVGSDNLLVTFDKDNKPSFSPFFEAINKHVLDHKIELLVLDNVADLFGGNEIIRAQVNFFVKSVCGAFIKNAKAVGFTLSVLLLSHPSQAGRNSGTGESGSTAWNNAVRARLYLTRPEDGIADQRVLTRKKSNYSSSGDDVKIDLLWENGALKGMRKRSSDVAVRSIENQIVQMVSSAWDAKRPYTAKKGHPRFLDGSMVEAFRHRGVAVETIVEALKSVKESGSIYQKNSHGVRGWACEVSDEEV